VALQSPHQHHPPEKINGAKLKKQLSNYENCYDYFKKCLTLLR